MSSLKEKMFCLSCQLMRNEKQRQSLIGRDRGAPPRRSEFGVEEPECNLFLNDICWSSLDRDGFTSSSFPKWLSLLSRNTKYKWKWISKNPYSWDEGNVKKPEICSWKDNYCLFLQGIFGTKGVFLKTGKEPTLKICNNKILWVICSELMSLQAGYDKKNMNMVCTMIMGPFDALRDSSFFRLTLVDLSRCINKCGSLNCKGRDLLCLDWVFNGAWLWKLGGKSMLEHCSIHGHIRKTDVHHE